MALMNACIIYDRKVYVYFMVSPAKVKRQYRLCLCVCTNYTNKTRKFES